MSRFHHDADYRHDIGGQFRIDDPTAIVDGQLIVQWTQGWWTWAMQSDADRNPSNDLSGAFASRHNHGDVFFVGGVPLVADATNISELAERAFRMPHNTPLLYPSSTASLPWRIRLRRTRSWRNSYQVCDWIVCS